ncbi:DUF2252 family protein [Streptomyces sp. KS 21]|uniref:DUF2252 family protein n=1 Tax=Streptomyces sp. KS 21 TaxID=2485150 RepID=UPI001063939B|nr:DUF2252 family protein [Streptomyces sp. KS 21]TDU74682.1 uncharacterized protein DUF2252 [Streptomyces sp. KS 21]
MTENHLSGDETRHLTPQERVARGKAARSDAPRSSHAAFEPSPDRLDPVEIIEKQSAKRVPELVPIRYSRMSEAPFRFYRGAAGQRERWDQATQRARTHDTLQVFGKLTHVIDGKRLIAPDPPLLVPLHDLLPTAERGTLEKELSRLIEHYGNTLQADRHFLLKGYRIADMARKVVGVGSVGTRCWIILLLGKDDEDPLFLQAKEADESVLAPYVGVSTFRTQGERVVSGQRLMQATSDIFDRALASFAELYADQNEKDHQALVDAIKAGRVPAEPA